MVAFEPDEKIGVGKMTLRILFMVVVIVFMANLGALTDMMLHPEIEYIDQAHVIVGLVTMVAMIIFFGGLALYATRMEKVLDWYRRADIGRKASEIK